MIFNRHNLGFCAARRSKTWPLPFVKRSKLQRRKLGDELLWLWPVLAVCCLNKCLLFDYCGRSFWKASPGLANFADKRRNIIKSSNLGSLGIPWNPPSSKHHQFLPGSEKKCTQIARGYCRSLGFFGQTNTFRTKACHLVWHRTLTLKLLGRGTTAVDPVLAAQLRNHGDDGSSEI